MLDSDIANFGFTKNTRFILEYVKIPNYVLGKSGLFDHFVQINAERYIPFSNFSSHNGDILSVAKTPFDLRWSKHLGRAIFKLPKDGRGKMGNLSICLNSYIKSKFKYHISLINNFLIILKFHIPCPVDLTKRMSFPTTIYMESSEITLLPELNIEKPVDTLKSTQTNPGCTSIQVIKIHSYLYN